jgi:hypothetical protein
MHHDRATGRMTGVIVGQMLNMSHDGMAGMAGMAPAAQPAAATTGHEGHVIPAPAAPPRDTVVPHDMSTMEMPAPNAPAPSPPSVVALRRMLQDPVIRRRVLADSALRRMLLESLDSLPAADRAQLQRLLTPTRSRRN